MVKSFVVVYPKMELVWYSRLFGIPEYWRLWYCIVILVYMSLNSLVSDTVVGIPVVGIPKCWRFLYAWY
jgi:hypothetical protein